MCVYYLCIRTCSVQKLLQALGEQQVPQSLHLRLQLPDQLGVRVLVDHGVAADLFGAVGVPGAASGARGQIRLNWIYLGPITATQRLTSGCSAFLHS